MASQIVLISGCSSGIGLATAVLLAKDAEKRFKVYATMRNLAKKGQLEEEGKDCLGDTLIIKEVDVCSDESVEKAVEEILNAEGRIDVLFNNAGYGFFSAVECVPISMAQDMFNVNFFGTLRLIKAVLPSMKARESGHIINHSSVGGIVGTPFVDIYCASKFAVEGLSESMAPLLRQFDISGIGLATAVLLAKDAEKRFKVYASMRNLTKKGQLEEEGKYCLGDTLIIKQMDVCSDESVEKAVKEVLDAEGRIDVLFNNAGYSFFSAVECVPISMAQDMFNVNFFGTLRLIKAVLPSMKARQSGHIINHSSVGGIVGIPFVDIYCASKFAVEGLSESLAPLLRQFDIRCTILETGPVQSQIHQTVVDWGKAIDHDKADEKTKNLREIWGENFQLLCSDKMETNEMAAFVRGIILGQNTNFRCYSHPDFLSDQITAKFKDPATNELIEVTRKQLFEKQKDGN